MKAGNYIFMWWVITFCFELFVFTLNPLLGIFFAITMIPIFIFDILYKLFIKPKEKNKNEI